MTDESTDDPMTASSDLIAGKVPLDAARWQGPSRSGVRVLYDRGGTTLYRQR